MGSLIDAVVKWLFKMWWSKLTPSTGTLTRARSANSGCAAEATAKVEAEVAIWRSWVV